MTNTEVKELAKSAAQSAVIAYSMKNFPMRSEEAVDLFLESYEYAMKKIYGKQCDAQQEFGTENSAKFR